MSDSQNVFYISKELHQGLYKFIERGNYRPLIAVHINIFQRLQPDYGIQDDFNKDFCKNVVVPILLEYSVISRSDSGEYTTEFDQLKVKDPERSAELLMNSLEYNVREIVREPPNKNGRHSKRASAFIKKTCDAAISKEAIDDIRRGFNKLHQAPNVKESNSSCTLEFALVGFYEEEGK